MLRGHTFRDALPALFVFVALATATVAGTLMLAAARTAEGESQFQQSVTQAYVAIDSAMDKFVTLLEASRAYVHSVRQLEGRDFSSFVEGLALRDRYPGFQGIGYAERMDVADIERFVAGMREAGVADYRVTTTTTSGTIYPIKFLEPADQRNRAALGYDMFGEETRRKAMERARDSGGPTASSAVTLRQEIDSPEHRGFLIYLPAYAGVPTADVEGRRQAISGFVYGAFRTTAMFEAMRPKLEAAGVDVEVRDAEPGAPVVFRTPGFDASRGSMKLPYQFAGHTWDVTYALSQAAKARQVNSVQALIAPIGGGLATLLLSLFIFRANRSDRTALEALRAREKAEGSLQLQTQLLEVAREPILILDEEGHVLTWNLGCERLYKYSRSEAIGRKSFELLRTVFPLPQEAFWKQLLDHGQITCELTHLAKDNTRIFVEARLETFRTSDGIRILKSDWDIRERKEAERQQYLLVRELTHRVKNLLAVVQSIVNNTIPPGPQTENFRRLLISRLHALARAQDIVTKSNEEGGNLLDVLHLQFEQDLDRVTIRGQPVIATANFAQMFSLVVNELATNAAKYGALSNTTGKIDIELSVVQDDGRDFLRFEWKETGGPPAQQPTTRGFGTRLILTAISGSNSPRPRAEYLPEGFHFISTTAMSAVNPHTEEREEPPEAAGA